jgi:hypothetical protein
MDIDQQIATALGFSKPKFMAVEQERRWLTSVARRIAEGRDPQTPR